MILAGEELHRFRLQRAVAALVEKSGVAFAATILGKSVLPESHPQYIGLYEGAMGKEAWVMLPYAPDWRWLLARSDTPWYPTLRLFRQGADRSWPPVIARIAGELAAALKME